MSIAKIIAPLSGAPRDAGVLATAFAAARAFNAHVAALLVHPDARLSVPYMGMPLSPQVVQNTIDAADALNRHATAVARAALEQEAEKAKVAIVEHPQRSDAVTCSFRESEGFFGTSVARAARLSDLVVFGSIVAADGPDINECFVDILTRTDRPVLLSAKVPSTMTGKAAIAWDGGGAACHAVGAALPFLLRSSEIVLLHVGSESGEESPFAPKASLQELKEYLSLQGLPAREQICERGTRSTGEALLDAARGCAADLLVMGGYGHSHLRETLFGGVTAHIRWHAELPVLMVH
ncbi:MAG TPA: universal stress protein [Rhizomicrobium sp.]|jgi:nucleotide-binding universal stress UspA family protein|nr:universal stress protein [Rhizomicrobium sp.]